MKGEYRYRVQYVILIVLAGAVCYLVGTVTVLFAHHVVPSPIVVEKNPFFRNNTTTISELQATHWFVASKNSDIFYPILCSYAERIKEQNRVYFAIEKDATRNGFTRSTQCLE